MHTRETKVIVQLTNLQSYRQKDVQVDNYANEVTMPEYINRLLRVNIYEVTTQSGKG